MAGCDPPLFQAVVSAALLRTAEFSPLALSYVAWALAKLLSQDVPYRPQSLGSPAGAFADRYVPAAPRFLRTAEEEFLASGGAKLRELSFTGLANLAWSFAILDLSYRPFFSAIADNAVLRLETAKPHSLAGMAWSFAHLSIENVPLMTKIMHLCCGRSDVDSWAMGDATSVTYAFWRSGSLEPSGGPLRPGSFAGAWPLEMNRAWSKAGAAPLANGSREWKGSRLQADKLKDLEAAIQSSRDTSAAALLDIIRRFGAGRGKWLKVAAGQKADVLTAALQARGLRPHEVALELGGFVGFSTLRMAQALQDYPAGSVPRVVSVEKDSGCARLARSMLDRTGQSMLAEVWNGRSSDLLYRILEEFGAASVGFAFFDHSGSIYHEDLAALEQLGLLASDAVIVADNVLKPGAPLFLWQLSGKAFDTKLVSLGEFAQPDIEDWMAVARRRKPRVPSAPPAELQLLSWKADLWRRRSERGTASIGDWRRFSEEMKQGLAEALPSTLEILRSAEDFEAHG